MKNKKVLIGFLVFFIILVIASIVTLMIMKNKETTQVQSNTTQSNQQQEEVKKAKEEDNKIDIVDINSKTRPYAIVVNNTPVAVKVQTGLNKAYIVYEIPTEGNTSRLMGLYKDIPEDLVVGTIRSSRHNFIDYALESDAIYVHYGWSHYAEDDEKAGAINYINGLFDAPFWRENPENLASEHTAYTSTEKIKQTAINKGFKAETETTTLLNYNAGDIDLSKKEDTKIANKIVIPYGANPNITTFEYDSTKKMYNRYEAGSLCVDYKSKENVETKNIIIQKINYSVCSDGKYWDLKTIGSGEGYYITNGYAVPITWKKDSRKGKTKYFYKNGQEIEVSDGRTYIEIQTNSQNLTIE